MIFRFLIAVSAVLTTLAVILFVWVAANGLIAFTLQFLQNTLAPLAHMREATYAECFAASLIRVTIAVLFVLLVRKK